MSYNRVILLGNITNDPELTQPFANSSLCRLNLALNKTWVDRDNNKRESVSYVEVKAYARLAENLAKFFKKGSPILIEGELKQDRWEKDGEKFSKVYVVAERFEFVQGKTQNSTPRAEPPRGAQPF